MRPPHLGWILVGATFAFGAFWMTVALALAIAPLKAELRVCTDSLFVTDGSGRVWNPRKAEAFDTVRHPSKGRVSPR